MKRPSVFTILLILTWVGLACCFSYSYVSAERNKSAIIVDFDPDQMPEMVEVGDDWFNPEIPAKFVEPTPKWDYKNDNPPISVRNVLKRAEEFRQKKLNVIQKRNDWYLKAIELCPVDIESEKWCWCVRYDTKPTGYAEIGPTVTFYIMMDGTELEPLYFTGLLDTFEQIHREWNAKVLSDDATSSAD